MKTEFKAKLLNHLIQRKKDDKGFTLIELLVVIIIIGILAAIALPAFLNQANKAKQSEAKTYVGSMNRGQQAYYLEKTAFVVDDKDFGKLGLGIATETENYQYRVKDGGSGTAVINRGIVRNPKAPLKAYVGGVSLATVQATSEATTLARLFEADQAVGVGGKNAPETMTFTQNDGPQAPSGFSDLGK
jgi:prepilin-type N-terminal cleavage/methylation domain-containing protein